MNKENLYPLLGKYLNGYKIVKIENDQFVKGQINLWTDTWEKDFCGDRYLVKFYVRPEDNSAKIYREIVDEKLNKLENNWKKLKEWIDDEIESQHHTTYWDVERKIQELECQENDIC